MPSCGSSRVSYFTLGGFGHSEPLGNWGFWQQISKISLVKMRWCYAQILCISETSREEEIKLNYLATDKNRSRSLKKFGGNIFPICSTVVPSALSHFLYVTNFFLKSKLTNLLPFSVLFWNRFNAFLYLSSVNTFVYLSSFGKKTENLSLPLGEKKDIKPVK